MSTDVRGKTGQSYKNLQSIDNTTLTFVSRIYLYDGDDARAEIYCNTSDKTINCPISEPLKSSSMEQLARRRGFEPPTFWSVARRSIQLSYRRSFVLTR